jgi:hypothetical protein
MIQACVLPARIVGHRSTYNEGISRFLCNNQKRVASTASDQIQRPTNLRPFKQSIPAYLRSLKPNVPRYVCLFKTNVPSYLRAGKRSVLFYLRSFKSDARFDLRLFKPNTPFYGPVLKDSVILSRDVDVRCVDVIDVSVLKIEIAGFYLFFGLEQLFIPYARELWVISFGEVEMKYTPREVAAHCL